MSNIKLQFNDATKLERPVLGDQIPISLFRILRIVALPEALGESSGPMLYTAGKSIGMQLPVTSFNNLLELIEGWKIGLGKILEQNDRKIIIQVDECTSCAGVPNVGGFVCSFEGGIIAGAFEKLLNKKVKAKEAKCWANGDGTCVFDCIIF